MEGPDSPVYALHKNPSMIDYPGHLSGVFMVSGCNFRCRFCHNPELMRRRQKGIPWERLESMCEELKDNWVDAAAVFGGEPTTAKDLEALLKLFKRLGWRVKVDTNGSNPERLAACLPYMDYVAMDVKASEAGYPALTGYADTDRVRASIALVRERAADYEFRTTVIESFHTDEEMHAVGALVRGARRYVLQAFVPQEDLPDPALAREPRTSDERLAALRVLMQGCADEVTVRG